MKAIVRILALVAVCMTAALPMRAHTLPSSETLTYKVMYKWGLVNKHAGTVTINLRTKGDEMVGLLTARTQPWADKMYKVRDTLRCTMKATTLAPSIYEKISHEGKDHKHDVVRYSRSGSTTIGNCIRRVWDNDKLVTNETRTLKAQGTTLDMMSAFYYMRTLDFPRFAIGHVVSVNVFSGKRQELLTIKYKGKQTVKVDGNKIECYHVTFIFTGEGRKKTSDDMDAWISADAARVPILLEGKLAVGKVRCFLQSK